MATVHYNFPVISLSLNGISSPSSQEIQLQKSGQPLTNIKLNDVNYTAYSILIASKPTGSTSEPGYLIVKCYADIYDTTSNSVFLAITLAITPSMEDKPDPVLSDVDKIIEASSETVNLNLNNYIKNSGSCYVSANTSFPVTITLDKKSAIPIQSYIGKKFYTIGSISGLTIESNVANRSNAIVQQQELDWIMSCELLTEDGPVEKQQVDPGTTATTITLFMMAIMISGATYVAGPILYNGLGMFNLAQKSLSGNHYSINVYWGVTLILIAIMCIMQGIASNNTIYYFIAISLILSFFAATSAILKINGVANTDGTGFESNGNALQVYFEIFSRNCYSTTGFILKILVFMFLVYSFLAMSGSMAMGNHVVFVTHMLLFIFVATLQLKAISYFNKISNPS